MAEQNGLPEWLVYPDTEWEIADPDEAGLDSEAFNAWAGRQTPRFGEAYGGQDPGKGGVVIARGGYLLRVWGDPDFRYQSASLGKTFTRMALQLAVDTGLIGSADDPVVDYWAGDGQLEAHKVLTLGHHRKLTFRHLEEMKGGFPVTNGYVWRNRGQAPPGTAYTSNIPAWATCTGDPDYDNYAHIEPGETACYSSGGYWRLSQALTVIWGRDLKSVLDDHIMRGIGIPANRWDWLSGETVRNNRDFYPDMPGYGDFIDPPHRINGIPVCGGGGWVVMGASDFARVGLLVATGGLWAGQRLLSEVGGNAGVGTNTMQGWEVVHEKDGYFSFGKVATRFEDPTPDEMASWIVGDIER